MRRVCTLLAVVALLSACGKPQDTPVPRDLEQLATLKPALDKLTPEERELFNGYVMRNTFGAVFGALAGRPAASAAAGIPEGMTIGKAIEEQRQLKAQQLAEEAKAKALAEQLKAARDAAMATMRDAVTVTLVSKKVDTQTFGNGMVLSEDLKVVFGYKNNGQKDIAGVKGLIVVRDLFGDQISAFQVSNDATIKAGATSTWTGSRSLRTFMDKNNDRKLGELADDKFKVEWLPQVVVFADGTKLQAPE